jgi:hypothetical protein
MSITDWIIAEFKALGWYCVAHGPEFWLVGPLAGAVLTAVIVGIIVGRYYK